MGVCGYNEKMGDGIRLLFEGMYEALATKSAADCISFEDILRRELIEIPQINVGLQAGDTTPLKMFLGLNVMALAHFSAVLDQADQHRKAYFAEAVDDFINTLREVEDFSVALPRDVRQSDKAIADRASQIAHWIKTEYCMEVV